PCNLTWREDGDYERVWVVNPAHPIAQGIGRYIYLEHEETYGEPFDVPEPDETVFIGGYEYGEVFRSGICYRRGRGRIFYFQPGHETFPTYKNKDVQTVIKNAVRWAAPVNKISALTCPNVKKPGTDGQ
ncbi:MAG: ThuA domain-containing protein, partial [Clostridia bacterium]|nr:ThuA domain-containing protein [Clostridia bacterium]